MIKKFIVAGLACAALTPAFAASWPPPEQPSLFAGTPGYVKVPGAALAPDPAHVYKIIFNATRKADKPNELAPSIGDAASVLSELRGQGVSPANSKFALVFHGPAVDAILSDANYKKKFGTANPNLPVLAALKAAGVELYVCGQMLAFEKIDPATLSTDVKLASDADLVLATYQNNGYGVLQY